jgi:hypothetical protein
MVEPGRQDAFRFALPEAVALDLLADESISGITTGEDQRTPSPSAWGCELESDVLADGREGTSPTLDQRWALCRSLMRDQSLRSLELV